MPEITTSEAMAPAGVAARRIDRRVLAIWAAVAVLTLFGLALRLAAARGALWLDEAWSATFAREAGTPLGVLLNVNHDNNHILNTWWLQFVGPGAPPLLQRALAIACGTATIPLAAAFASRRGAAAALVAALAFALSPMLVTYGAEARGYAPMLAATLVVLLLVARWLEGRPPATIGLALAALLGTLAQPLMLASLAAILGWAVLTLARRDGVARALSATARTLGPAFAAALLVLAIMAAAAEASPHAFTIGSYDPFAAADWVRALSSALGWTLGFRAPALLAIPAAILLAILLWARRADPRTTFFALALLAFPLALAALRVGNTGIPRYYLLASLALLLLLAELLGPALARRGAGRWIAAAALALFAIGSARLDAAIATNLRADPARAIAAMRRAAPAGAALMLPDARMTPVLRWAARDAGYRLRLLPSGCGPAPFLLLDGDPRAPGLVRLCGGDYRRVARARPAGLSGTAWSLYRRVG